MRPLLIIDFEATCWGPDEFPPAPKAGRQYANEIIEFGCALLDDHGKAIAKSWQQYVMPVNHCRLTAFCTELTGIEQATVDAAPTFPIALENFRQYFGIQGGAEPRFASWGNYDRNILLDDCAKHDLPYPFRRANHVNLKAEAVDALGLKRRMGLSRTLKAIGLEFEGSPHSGLDDARNISRIAIEMLKRGWKPPVRKRTS